MDLRIFRTLLLATLSYFHFSSVNSLNCIQCSQSHFHGEPGLDDCYKLDDKEIINETSCLVTDADSYCFTKMELTDGILSYLERGCTNPREDPVEASNSYPDSVKCTTSYSRSKRSKNIQQTECYVPCKGHMCNDIKVLDNLKSCPRACPTNSECNYLTGKCQCAADVEGSDCNTKATQLVHGGRVCVQCNSEYDSNCANKTTGDRCQNGETHCSTTQTWILKPDGSVVNDPVVTRSCTGQSMSPDRCYLTPTNDIGTAKYTEYTCVSTCSTNRCNIGMANGDLDKEFIPMRCVVCEGDEFSCGPERKLMTDCPKNTTHCLATVTYWETNVKDSKLEGRVKPDPSVSVRSIKRECSVEPVATKCTAKRIGSLNLKEITCQESCVGDGCNTGWPSRPKCIQCNKKADASDEDECLLYPSTAKYCPGPHQKFCYTYLQNWTLPEIDIGISDQRYSITRGCSTYEESFIRDEYCKNITEYGRNVGMECVKYCSKHGCNYGLREFKYAQGNKNSATARISSKSTSFMLALFFFLQTHW
ncbi:uncharacterized protein LOC120329939 [Styela clava]